MKGFILPIIIVIAFLALVVAVTVSEFRKSEVGKEVVGYQERIDSALQTADDKPRH